MCIHIIYIYICIYVYIHMCIYIYTYIYIYHLKSKSPPRDSQAGDISQTHPVLNKLAFMIKTYRMIDNLENAMYLNIKPSCVNYMFNLYHIILTCMLNLYKFIACPRPGARRSTRRSRSVLSSLVL